MNKLDGEGKEKESDTGVTLSEPPLVSSPRPLFLANDDCSSLEGLAAVLERIGVPLPTDLEARCASLTNGVTPNQILTASDAKILAASWTALLDACRTSRDTSAQIVTFAAFLIRLRRVSRDLEEDLSRHRLWLARTCSEAALRLFNCGYHLGRTMILNSTPQVSRAGRLLLEEALLTSELVMLSLHKNPRTHRVFYGQRGVARLLLARGRDSEAPVLMLHQVLSDLQRSRELGDTSPQHYEYELEVLFRIHKHTGDDSALAAAEGLLVQCGTVTRGLLYSAGELWLRRGLAAADREQWTEAKDSFSRAIPYFSRAFEAIPEVKDVRDGLLYAKRAQAQLRLYTAGYEAGDGADASLLDAAIRDAQRVPSGTPAGGAVLPAALLLRAMLHREQGKTGEAVDDLRNVLAFTSADASEPELRDVRARAEALLAELLLWRALERGTVAQVEDALRGLLNAPREGEPSVAPIGPAVDRLAEELGVASCATLIRAAAAFVEGSLQAPHIIGSSRRFLASHAGSILLWLPDPPALGRSVTGNLPAPGVAIEIAELHRAYTLLKEAVAASSELPPPELLGRVGEAALRLSKRLLRDGVEEEDARPILEDACEHIKMSLASTERASPGFRLTEGYSKLGEAYVRLHALTFEDDHAERAIQALLRSRDLGNRSAELLGLLGDAYYRRGRARNALNDLRRAVEFKAEARSVGHQSRENWSVSGAAYVRMWRITGDRSQLASAAAAMSSAHYADPTWPWPPLQLSEVAQLPEHIRQETLQGSTTPSRLVALAREGDAGALVRLGAELAVATSEFRRQSLGGRRKRMEDIEDRVHYLDDPYGLLSDAMVFKPAQLDVVEYEAEATTKFGKYLRDRNAPPYLRLPVPMAIVTRPTGRVPVYVMRRERGRKLGSLAIDVTYGADLDVSAHTRRAAEFLAYYHAWGWPRSNTRLRLARENVERVALQAQSGWSALGAPEHLTARLRELLLRIMPRGGPSLLKKDAHPENWLVTSDGNLVMIDLESHSALPLFYEVAQLIEDYPLLPCDERGAQSRREILLHYVETLRSLEPDILTRWDRDFWPSYEAFCVYRISEGLIRLDHGLRNQNDSTSFLRAAPERFKHYFQLLRWLSEAGASSVISECAGLLSAVVRASSAGTVVEQRLGR